MKLATRSTRPLILSAGFSLLAIAAAATLTACGGGDDAVATATAPAAVTVTLIGTAATGAPMANALVTATNAKGVQATARTGTDGKFSIGVADAAPYALSVTDASGKVWYSFAAQAGVANITPLTTLALLDANGQKPLADLFKAWASAGLSADAVLASARKVNANLQALMAANGLDASKLNVFAAPFAADHTGLDALLDAMRVSFNCSATACSQSILGAQGNVLVSWNGNIATTGITLSWAATDNTGTGSSGTLVVGLGSCKAPKAGTYSLVVQTVAAGIAIPEICIDGLPDKPASQADFCGGADINAQLPAGVSIKSCTYSGNVGSITAQIITPFPIDYAVTYTFVKH